jgi:hypothetical protein
MSPASNVEQPSSNTEKPPISVLDTQAKQPPVQQKIHQLSDVEKQTELSQKIQELKVKVEARAISSQYDLLILR